MKHYNYKDNDVAIIGMAGRFSEADDLEEFWLNLVSARESIREFPDSRKRELERIIPEIRDMDFSKSGYLEHVLLFEPEVFSISHEESKYIDPQHRILLEMVEDAILDAGYNPKQLSGKEIGVFVADNGINYTERIVDSSSAMKFVNSVASTNAGRIAYTYNFYGPVLTLGTACSSSLVAIHYACQSLSIGEVDFAIAGGSIISLLPGEKSTINKQSVMSIDQKVRSFDRDADGTVGGEGGGIVFLKLLKKALEDGDNIHAIIKGSAVNSNGSRANGIAAPSEKGQNDVILKAIQNAQIDPKSISYIETHGTGTKVGDPIEAAGISSALNKLNYKKQSVGITSLKPNIGHLDSSAGIAGVLKTILMLKNRKIPASLNFKNPNPLIDFVNSPIYINDNLAVWDCQGVRRAGVTSLGLIGSNCHMILEEAPLIEEQTDRNGKNLVLLSARTQKSLTAMVEKLNTYLSRNRHLSIDSISYTLNVGRRSYPHKFATVVNSNDELIDQLSMYLKDLKADCTISREYKAFQSVEKKDISIIYIIPDLEEPDLFLQYELYNEHLSYRECFDECTKTIEDPADLNNMKVLYLIHVYSYVNLLKLYSIKVRAVLGIGIGDLIADLVMGKKSFQETLKAVKEYNQAKITIKEKKLANMIDKIRKTDINTFALLFPSQELSNLFTSLVIKEEKGLLLEFEKNQNSFYIAIIKLIENGMHFNWERIYEKQNRKRISLPGYVFDRKSYFIEREELVRNKHNTTDYDMKHGVKFENEVSDNRSIKDTLYSLFSEIYQGESFSLDNHIYQLELDSISIMQFAGKLKKIYNIDVPLTMFFKGMTIGAIFDSLEESINSRVVPLGIIEKQPEKELYNVSSAQKRVFILNQLTHDNISYNMPMIIMIKGRLDAEGVNNAFKRLVSRHEILRTSFLFQDSELMQQIHKDMDFQMDFLESKEDCIDEMIKNFVRPFDLGKAPLLRASLVKLTETKHILLFDMHHIISDGTSMSILIREVFALYQGEKLDDLAIQYKDFSAWQNQFFKSDAIKKQEIYWLNVFSGEIPTLNMPTDYPRPALQSFEGNKLTFQLDGQLVEALHKLAEQTQSTLYMVLLAMYNVLLYKYTGQEDIIIGSPIAGRRHGDLENTIGMFINTIAMRNYPNGYKTFMEFLEEVRDNASKAYENQDYQFEELVEKLQLNRNLSRNPLFDTMFTLLSSKNEENYIDGIQFNEYEFSSGIAKFDLDLSCRNTETAIKFNMEYCTKLYSRTTMESMINNFVTIINKVVDNPYIKISDIEMLSLEERNKITFEFNNTKVEYTNDQIIHKLFEKQVEKSADCVAIEFGDQQITYKELNNKANQLARILRQKGIGEECIVGIMVTRSIDMIIGIIAILKAGAAYLPIDPEYPRERTNYILEDSGAQMLLTQKMFLNKVDFGGEVLFLEDNCSWEKDDSNLENFNIPDNLAYLIYTSGSTGNPKGVMVEHRAVNNFIHGMTEKINFSEKKTILALTTICFDIFLLETLLPLLKGMKVVIANENEQINPKALAEVIIKNKVDMLQITPSRMQLLMNDNKSTECLKTLTDIMLGGEPLPQTMLEELQKKVTARIYNMYGPTETTVWSTLSDLTQSKKVNIGKPIANTQIYILDNNRGLLPINAVGELYISGDSLARGYVNRPELTAEKFVENPFDSEDIMSNNRIYRTGDLAKWMPDGNIEIIGRVDYQLKIRGYRIEPGEIEQAILKYKGVKEVVVVDGADSNGTKYLCAYFVTTEKEYSISGLREYLTDKLPEYMIPSYFMELDKLPLTPNGKINRKALPLRDNNIRTKNKYIAPRNGLEKKLIKLWQEVLDVESLGIDDSFFELGGHSLKATILISKMEKELNIQVQLGDLFKMPTVKSLARYIEEQEIRVYKAIPKVGRKDYYPISSSLKAIFKCNQEAETGGIYNKTGILIIEGNLDKNQLEKSLKELIKRHEILRTSFEIIDGEPVQRIYEAIDFKIDYIISEENNLDDIITSYIKPFNLNKLPLLRVGLVQLVPKRHALLFDMHQIITDGTSSNIFIKEIMSLYQGRNLPELTVQYKDYSVWYEELHKSNLIKKQKEFWLNKFSGHIPLLNLPTDYERPKTEDYRAARMVFTINRELTHELKALEYKLDATLYMILLSAYNVLLYQYTGQEDIIIGTPIAARRHTDLQNTMGLFVNNIAMRNYPQKDKPFVEFVEEVKRNALQAYENQDYQFEKLVEDLELCRQTNRNPLFDTMFALHNMHNEEFEMDNFKFIPYEIKICSIKYDLVFHVNEMHEEISFDLRYRTTLFNKDTIAKMVEQYIVIIQKIVNRPEIILGEI